MLPLKCTGVAGEGGWVDPWDSSAASCALGEVGKYSGVVNLLSVDSLRLDQNQQPPRWRSVVEYGHFKFGQVCDFPTMLNCTCVDVGTLCSIPIPGLHTLQLMGGHVAVWALWFALFLHSNVDDKVQVKVPMCSSPIVCLLRKHSAAFKSKLMPSLMGFQICFMQFSMNKICTNYIRSTKPVHVSVPRKLPRPLNC